MNSNLFNTKSTMVTPIAPNNTKSVFRSDSFFGKNIHMIVAIYCLYGNNLNHQSAKIVSHINFETIGILHLFTHNILHIMPTQS